MSTNSFENSFEPSSKRTKTLQIPSSSNDVICNSSSSSLFDEVIDSFKESSSLCGTQDSSTIGNFLLNNTIFHSNIILYF